MVFGAQETFIIIITHNSILWLSFPDHCNLSKHTYH